MNGLLPRDHDFAVVGSARHGPASVAGSQLEVFTLDGIVARLKRVALVRNAAVFGSGLSFREKSFLGLAPKVCHLIGQRTELIMQA